MIHDDHVALLRAGVPDLGGRWVDLGSGTDAFTLALADLLGSGGQIASIDRDRGTLRQKESTMRDRFPGCRLSTGSQILPARSTWRCLMGS